MRIAQIAPLFESVPPQLYGGTERIVSFLTEELVRLGHEVTLFASGDSQTRAQLVAPCPSALRLKKRNDVAVGLHTLMMEQVFEQADQFDVIHSHVDYLAFPLARRYKTATLTTLHGRLDFPELIPIYDAFQDMPLIAISDSQRTALPRAQWVRTVHHGMPVDAYPLQPRPGSYLAFLGRISQDKGLHRAISIAERAGIPLKIAAKVDPQEIDYFEHVVKPLLHHPGVEYVGEIAEHQKAEFLGNALGMLFPIDWPEPFGLVLIEAMACGTPVIAYPCGAVPEILEHGTTGFIVKNETDAVKAVGLLGVLPRPRIRRRFEERFSANRMAREYIQAYEQVLAGGIPLKVRAHV